MERHRGKAGDEHDLERGIELGGPARQFDAVHLGHDDVGQEQVEAGLLDFLEGAQALAEAGHVVAGLLQRLHQEVPHVVVVFRKQDLRHGLGRHRHNFPAPREPPLRNAF